MSCYLPWREIDVTNFELRYDQAKYSICARRNYSKLILYLLGYGKKYPQGIYSYMDTCYVHVDQYANSRMGIPKFGNIVHVGQYCNGVTPRGYQGDVRGVSGKCQGNVRGSAHVSLY